jgi:MFS family permease
MVRHSYVHEMRTAATYPLAAALAEGAFTSVVAAKYFHAPPVLIAVITAAPMFGNIMALFWSHAAERRPKVRFVNWLQAGLISCIALVALTWFLPLAIGGWVFAALIIVARLLAAGILTVRSAIWRMNYPRHLRGQIVGRISVVATTVLAITTIAGARWLDATQGIAYVMLYPAASVLGALGIWQFSRIRVRHEWRFRANPPVHLVRPENLAQTGEGNVLGYQVPRERAGFWTKARTVLREDTRFRDYMRWQFVSGMAFMMMSAPLLVMVTRSMTDPNGDYALATLVVQIVPMVTSIVFTPIWAPFFDRVSILKFRISQGMVTVTAMAILFAGALMDQLWIVALSQVLVGISNAGGNLAWNLGHNDFSTAENAPTYMAVNVMLTGTRGFFAPFLGIWLYQGFAGRYVFGICALLSALGQYGFYRMQRLGDVRPASLR